MKLKITEYGNRTYLFVDGKKTRMLPMAYHHLKAEQIYKSLSKSKLLTLSRKERAFLNMVCFIKDLKTDEPYIYELIGKAKPFVAHFVNVHSQEGRYEIKFDNGTRIKCSKELYKSFEPKKTIFSNY